MARVSVFVGDASRVDRQALPGVAFLETHSCLTAYVRAEALGRRHVANLYDTRWWSGSHGLPPRAPGEVDPYRPFTLDYFAYPPPFLLAMLPLVPLDGDYAAQRALWFGLNAMLFAVGLGVVARWTDGPHGHRTWLLAPLLFGSLPMLVTLQVGNFQIAVVVLAVLAMVAFDSERPRTGGALLAFAALSKLSPAVLGLVLLAQRRWRHAAYTAGFGALFVALSALATGTDPLVSFVRYALPRIRSGEAFAFLDDDLFSVFTNLSPFGVPFKLQLLGVHVADPWSAARRIGHGYAAALVIFLGFTMRSAAPDRGTRAVTWMSLLVLASLQSPFAPGYVSMGALWAITLLATEVRRLRGAATLALAWVGIAAFVHFRDVRMLGVESLVQSALVVVVPGTLVLRAARRRAA